MIPYNQKLWGVHPREITAEWCSRFVPIPKLEDVIKGAVGDVPPELGYNISFLYPQKGGIETLTRALVVAPRRAATVQLSTPVEKHRSGARARVTLGGETMPWRALVATIPLPELVRAPGRSAARDRGGGGQAALHAGALPQRRDQVVAARPTSTGSTCPRRSIPFYRVGIYTNAVPAMAPPGRGSLYVELSDRGPMPQRRRHHARRGAGAGRGRRDQLAPTTCCSPSSKS